MLVKLGTPVLADRLKQLMAIVDSKPVNPIFNYIRLIMQDGAATFCANNSPVGMLEVTVKAEGENGSLLLPAKQLADIAQGFQADFVTFQSDDTVDGAGNATVVVKCGRFKGSLRSRPASEFVVNYPTPDGLLVTSLPRPGFLDTVEKIAFAVPKSAGKYTVPVGKLDFKEDKLQLAATDGFKLVVAQMTGEYRSPEGFVPDGICLPKTAMDLFHLLTGPTFTLAETENTFVFQTESEIFTALKVSGDFPPYEKAIPTSEPLGKLTVAKNELTLALSRVAPIADKEKPFVSFSAFLGEGDAASLSFRSTSAAFGMADDSIDVKATGSKQDFVLDINNFSPFVDKAAELLDNEFRNPQAVVVFHSGPHYHLYIMPSAVTPA